jgi:hypothetical protein
MVGVSVGVLVGVGETVGVEVCVAVGEGVTLGVRVAVRVVVGRFVCVAVGLGSNGWLQEASHPEISDKHINQAKCLLWSDGKE